MARARRRTKPKFASPAVIFANCATNCEHDEGIGFCCDLCFVAAIASALSSRKISLVTLLDEIRQLKKKRTQRAARVHEGR